MIIDNEITKAIKMAGRNLINSLNKDRGYLPYWELRISRDYKAEYVFDWPQHNIGRWWDAMLRLEGAFGFFIPEEIESAMLNNTKVFFDNFDDLCFQPIGFDVQPRALELHSLREGMLALVALIKYRKSEWAREKAHNMILSVDRILLEDMSWDYEKIEYYHKCGKVKQERHFDPVGSSGRLCEALLFYFQETHDPDSLKLAKRIMEYHYANSTMPDGNIGMKSKPDHMHSYMNMLQAMVLFGQVTGQRKYIDRVACVMETFVLHTIKESGFTAHDLFTDTRGETASPADAMQIALWLTSEGYEQFADFSERILRARLLPGQLRETPPMKPVKNDGADCHNNLAERAIGGYSMHKEPHAGKRNTTDVTASCLHSLIDAYHHIVIRKPHGLFVLLHFDYEDDVISLCTKRSEEAKLYIQVKKATPVFVRIPQWTEQKSVKLSVNGRIILICMTGIYAFAGTIKPGDKAEFSFALPERTIHEVTDGVDYTICWKGDEVVGIRPNTSFYPFYSNLIQ